MDSSEHSQDNPTRQVLREELRRHRRKLLALVLGVVALVGGLVQLPAVPYAAPSLGIVYLVVGSTLTIVGVTLLWWSTKPVSS